MLEKFSLQDQASVLINSGFVNRTSGDTTGKAAPLTHQIRTDPRVQRLCEIATKDSSDVRREMAMRTLRVEQPGGGENRLNVDAEFVLSEWKERAQ